MFTTESYFEKATRTKNNNIKINKDEIKTIMKEFYERKATGSEGC